MVNSKERDNLPEHNSAEVEMNDSAQNSNDVHDRMKATMRYAQEYYPELSGEDLKERAKDMIHCYDKYKMSLVEYTNFRAETIPEEKRGDFITDAFRHQYYKRFNRPETKKLFNQKDLTYHLFRDYYRRELCAFTKLEQINEFYSFLQKHKRVIIKPLYGTYGKHIQIIDFAVYPELLAEYRLGFVAEELIRQSDEMAALNPESVNTVRMTTVRCDDHVEFLTPLLKCGRHGSCVDNASAGGIACELDPATGTVIRATLKAGMPVTHHPDNGMQLVGFQVPCWKELLELTEQLCYVVPDNRYTGWDLAKTDDGWAMIEGNTCGGFLMQIVCRKGVKPQLDALLEQIEHPTSNKS